MIAVIGYEAFFKKLDIMLVHNFICFVNHTQFILHTCLVCIHTKYMSVQCTTSFVFHPFSSVTGVAF